MALSNYMNFIIFARFVFVFPFAASQDKLVDPGCEAASVNDICDATLFPGSCYESLNAMVDSNISQYKGILKRSIQRTMNLHSLASPAFAPNGTVEKLIIKSAPDNSLALSALDSCRELISIAMTNLKYSFSLSDLTSSAEIRGSIRSRLCAAGAYLQTCLDGFDDALAYVVRNLVYEKLQSSIEHNILSSAIMTQIDRCSTTTGVSNKIGSSGQGLSDGAPDWLSSRDRRLLEDARVNANVVVANDGSGNYRRISDALRVVPDHSNRRFIIYVKKGVYIENVYIRAPQHNVMMIGDGMYQTVVSGRLSQGGGYSILQSATFAVYGQGFMARDMGFVNTAGPGNNQAVALMTSADMSVFYRCHMDGYQDTLFVHAQRQFYRECHIRGTIDFIFGHAAVVLQKCVIAPKRPLPNQENVIAAHHKINPQCNTGIVMHKSIINSTEDLTGVDTYLGRPWGDYSTIVFMESYIPNIIHPRGWRPWDPKTAARTQMTNFLAEFMNNGSGANTYRRAKWIGARVGLSQAEANKFTVRSFIQGDQWLPAMSVPFYSDL